MPILNPVVLDKRVLRTFPALFDELQESQSITPVITADQLAKLLTPEQNKVVAQILSLDPAVYGIHATPIGVESVPKKLAVITGQEFVEHGETKKLSDKYLPPAVYSAFMTMKEVFEKSTPGRTLLVESGYRSPAYQVLTFLNWLTRFYNGDIKRTIRHVALPTYSQHCSASHTAIDIKNVDGQPTNEDPEAFRNTVEYPWLAEHAHNFGFYESYPQDGQAGMRWEPWHWQYRGPE